MNEKNFIKVWGDTVVLSELLLSSVIGIISTLGTYGLVNYLLQNYSSIENNKITGYALIAGIIGCFVSGVISAKIFKPKRIVVEGTEKMDIQKILEEAGTSVEEEAKALSQADPELIKEMEDLELYALLSLIPEDSPNYKPQYREIIEGGKSR